MKRYYFMGFVLVVFGLYLSACNFLENKPAQEWFEYKGKKYHYTELSVSSKHLGRQLGTIKIDGVMNKLMEVKGLNSNEWIAIQMESQSTVSIFVYIPTSHKSIQNEIEKKIKPDQFIIKKENFSNPIAPIETITDPQLIYMLLQSKKQKILNINLEEQSNSTYNLYFTSKKLPPYAYRELTYIQSGNQGFVQTDYQRYFKLPSPLIYSNNMK
ncbi:hypothetical protein SAMN05444392_101109 [Seinonella peptonophila]|uniref:Uncharacterized protein n=1 Tax=Seinonella peptonophila TaxID=112248 RepID=A0A1M4SRZ9_9BACL|nr:hypothetical protein [Seinonella peptonophila]SHE34966.1 hypothetical protein SAMN05444392_101109 [Seinonella peptonophila]